MANFIDSLRKTRFNIKRSLHSLVSSQDTISENDFIQILDSLTNSDIGQKYAHAITQEIKTYCHKHSIVQKKQLILAIKTVCKLWLDPAKINWQPNTNHAHEMILVFGINGAGKTTSIAKLAKLLLAKDKKVMLVAGDTYRAAAVEQLKAWGDKLKIKTLSANQGADSASLIFDAIKTSQEAKNDILIADTSGRLHNNNNLMQELKKIVRVCSKADINAPQYKWLVLDATLGLNSIQQARVFHENLGINGIIITKIDSSAKAGAIFAIVKELEIPIYFVTNGEGEEDILEFSVDNFVDSLFNLDES